MLICHTKKGKALAQGAKRVREKEKSEGRIFEKSSGKKI